MQQTKEFSDFLQDLKRRNSIVDIVSNYVRLEQRGRRYWGCCPFHSEKTPSFSVNEEDGIYFCFGCKESGDVIKFVEKIENLDFMDAVHFLADKSGMEVPKFNASADFKKNRDERARLLSALDFAQKHYMENLYSPDAKIAQEYVKKRKFTRRELEDFKIGYSKNWHDMPKYLASKGFSEKEMIDAGICNKKEGAIFDVLGQRLVFPIFNSFSECIGFSARALEKTDFAKYKNTAETRVFQKGKVVFGINLLKAQKQQQLLDKIILVEGQMDVIAMHKAGFKCTVACMGTALTKDHVRELLKYNNNIFLCFDADEAGQKATMRAIEMFRNEDVVLKVVTLSGGKDPDEVLENEGKEGLQKMIDSAIGYMEFLLEHHKRRFNLQNAEQRGKFVKVALSEIRKLGSYSLAEPYLEMVRDLTNVPLDILRRELGREEQAPKTVPREQEKPQIRESGDQRAQKFILSSLLHKKDWVDKDVAYDKLLDDFDKYLEIIKKDMPVSSVFEIEGANEDEFLMELVNFNFAPFEQNGERYFRECLWKVAEMKLKKMQSALSDEFKNCQDLTMRGEIAKKLSAIAQQLKVKSLEEFNARR